MASLEKVAKDNSEASSSIDLLEQQKMKYKIHQHYERTLRQCHDNPNIRGINNEIKTLEA